MATGSLVPYSNPAGNNQTSSMASTSKIGAGIGIIPTSNPLSPTSTTATSNPFLPQQLPSTPQPIVSTAQPIAGTGVVNTGSATTGAVPATTSSTGATPNTSAANGFITNNSSYSSGENDLQKQLIDIYGKGIGGSLFALLNNMSGTDSTVLQEYIQSLQPQFAQAKAGLGASLGAGGVSANSSVAALGESNLQEQENSLVAGESANLTQNQEQLTAQLLSGMGQAGASEVATSGWGDFANALQGVGNLGAEVIGDYAKGVGESGQSFSSIF